MVNLKFRREKFTSGQSGLAMTEALIVIPLLMLVFGAMVEFSAMVFQWSQVVKATQISARRAAVSSPLTDISALSNYGTGAVVSAPISPPFPAPISCGAGTTACDSTQLDRLYYGSDNNCTDFDPNGVVGFCDVAWFVPKSSIRVTYSRSDLGYVGRPAGPVVTVTVETRNLYFNFFLLDQIMAYFGPLGMPAGISIPPHPVSMTSEDLCSGVSC
ncbi:TadE/TadG family type IV pilus assembly protein [Alisedimentitalea sp. MJ-SS2]|uniref:TadE/TadG family type IV pilus assembly protein n=1 Tax=Aliisedimentitalea sp. MJ-SS2 TaxID=3049795 RepID=UPI00291209D0|nr:TadE/TadG family type IV pilus assembly protein [Alisedimentitalea sp. MJ-SS2]MDU8928274.1 TadE/TadG family type IV pilus assembly protein [Alisedimentitalea sp. MJ-SS2]